jgi:hypothetical protein
MEALSRLLAKYVEHINENPGSGLNLKDLLTDDNVDAVRKLDLCAEYGPEKRQRDVQMLRAWQQPRRGARQ